jgi:valyl-tRNA synthetase
VGRKQLTKTFDHRTEESSIYQNWETSGAFAPRGDGPAYFLPMPPPNITGILHMGHALFATLQDISTRYHRMKGDATLWLPGSDHAGLATQDKLDALMIEQGLDPNGPEFDAFAETYKLSLQGTIMKQLRSCGASCDWSRETFTLDDRYSNAVQTAWKKCNDAGLTYAKEGELFINMEPLAKRLLDHLDAGDLKIIPAGGEGTLRNFLTKIEPWNISRKIRWGHKIPGWFHDGHNMVFDTWFSSALWPFATLGWPDDTEDMQRFYPAAMIETADDILFFWCARMLMMGLLLTDRLPFDTIFLHGLIRDKHGKKMSKSAGNGIDPLDIIERYGADSMRFALAEAATPGQDMRMWDDKFQAGKALRTKLWNAARYSLAHYERLGSPQEPFKPSKHYDDVEMEKRLTAAHRDATEAFEELRYHEAAHGIRKFIFEDLCGWYIEATKSRLYDEDDQDALQTLMWALDGTLKMLHPIMPFITERIREAYSGTPLITDAW